MADETDLAAQIAVSLVESAAAALSQKGVSILAKARARLETFLRAIVAPKKVNYFFAGQFMRLDGSKFVFSQLPKKVADVFELTRGISSEREALGRLEAEIQARLQSRKTAYKALLSKKQT